MTSLDEKILDFAKNKENSATTINQYFFTTSELEKEFQIGRTQASRAANQLVDALEFLKINSRPVLFASKQILEKNYDVTFHNEYSSIEELIQKIEEIPADIVFEKMVGSSGSLAEAIEQIKTAVHYPGDGLPILFLGDTGVGKSYFVQLMYEYMLRAQLLEKDAPFKTLNCAQYSNNPELLSGLLFGYTKGAFTGAYKNQKGLLAEADHGLLFLDEVHRLSEEGQEKLFNFMDKGEFTPIGGTENQKSNVRFAFATTEKTDIFLQTFLRRIPIQISIPNVEERTIIEKRKLIEFLFQKESQLINKDLEITASVLTLLLKTKFVGNIGEMENTIKYACGSAFTQEDKKERLLIKIKNLPTKIYTRIHSNEVQVITEEETMFIYKTKLTTENKQPITRLEKFILRLNALFETYQGEDEHELRQLLNQQTVQFIDELVFKENPQDRHHLETFIVSTMQEIFRQIDERIAVPYDGNLVLFLAHYIYRYVLKGNTAANQLSINVRSFIEKKSPNEKKLLQKILPEIQKRLDVTFNKGDQLLFLLFIDSLQPERKRLEVDAILIAHGYATASSIANVCNRMLQVTTYTGIDMPIEATIHDISERVTEYIQNNQVDQGLIVLIDMGSLNMIYDQLKQIINVPVLFIDQLSTPMALEIGNWIIQGKSLQEIAENMQEVITPNIQLFKPKRQKQLAILTTCLTGVGTAIQIQKLLSDCLEGIIDIVILPIEYSSLKTDGIPTNISEKYEILSIIGTNDPQLENTKFVYLENIISGQDDGKLHIIFEKLLPKQQIQQINDRLVKNFSLIRVIDSLTILDTKTVMETIETCIQKLEERLTLQLTNARKVALYVHVSCMIERLIRHSEISEFPDLEQFAFDHQKEIRVIKDVFSVLEPVYSVTVPLEEIGYIHNILYLP